jgi:hypothetical protein
MDHLRLWTMVFLRRDERRLIGRRYVPFRRLAWPVRNFDRPIWWDHQWTNHRQVVQRTRWDRRIHRRVLWVCCERDLVKCVLDNFILIGILKKMFMATKTEFFWATKPLNKNLYVSHKFDKSGKKNVFVQLYSTWSQNKIKK